MGVVWRAVDTTLGRHVALKTLPEAVAGDPQRLARLVSEAQAVAALSHPNVVTVYAVEQIDGVHLLAMEWVEGETLDRSTVPPGLPLDRFFALAVPLADALRAAHERGVLHRDLKPANVMVDREGRLRVLDFGLAKFAGSALASDAAPTVALTGEGSLLGTLPYMSPEQLRGRAEPRSDVFALGALLYELLAARRAFSGASPPEVIMSILHEEPPPRSCVTRWWPCAVAPNRSCHVRRRGDRWRCYHWSVSGVARSRSCSPTVSPRRSSPISPGWEASR